jgi:phosphoadenosine phosphosulfate reductase
MTQTRPIDCDAVQEALLRLDAKERIQWAAETFSDSLVLLSSMQRTAAVLMHLFAELALPNEVLFVDTGYHFFETLQVRDLSMRRYRLNLVTLYPDLTLEEQETKFGKKLFSCVDGQPTCCHLRKEAPLLKHLAGKPGAVVTNGLRRAEGGRRASLKILTPDPRTGGHQFSPLFDWSDEDLLAHIAKYNLPLHPLYEKGYQSIGCYPCTTPVRPGEDARAGRWRHLRPADSNQGPTYCSINFTDGEGI